MKKYFFIAGYIALNLSFGFLMLLTFMKADTRILALVFCGFLGIFGLLVNWDNSPKK
jgi:hypothetical protein